jgi:hypothetical protein
MSQYTELPVFNDEPASEEFRLLISECLGCDNDFHILDCLMCNRTHFSHNWKNSLSGNDILSLEKKMSECPQKFHDTCSDEPVTTLRYNGQIVVLDCPCNFFGKVEFDFIQHRHLIQGYFKIIDRREKRSKVRGLRTTSSIEFPPLHLFQG